MANDAHKTLAIAAKSACLNEGHYAPLPHDLWRRVIPIAREYDKAFASLALLYTYLLAHTNGKADNPRYMAAFPSVETIAAETGIGRNRIAKLSDVLEGVGLLVTDYEYSGRGKRSKLYYPLYKSRLTDAEIRRYFDLNHSAETT